jgi:hypothetical protein
LAETPEVLNIILVKKLSQLSDGPLNGLKRLAVCMLWQSETQLVAELAFRRRLHLPVFIRFLAKFHHGLLETSYMKNVTNELSFLLVTHTTCFSIWFGRYGILNSGSICGRFWTDWVYDS